MGGNMFKHQDLKRTEEKLPVYGSDNHLLRDSPTEAQHSRDSAISGAHHFGSVIDLVPDILLDIHLICTAARFTDDITKYQSDWSNCTHKANISVRTYILSQVHQTPKPLFVLHDCKM